MGFQRAKEDRPTPPEVYNWKVYASAIIISLGVLAYGYDSSFIGTTITQASFKRDFGLEDMTKSEQNAVSSNLTSICTYFLIYLHQTALTIQQILPVASSEHSSCFSRWSFWDGGGRLSLPIRSSQRELFCALFRRTSLA